MQIETQTNSIKQQKQFQLVESNCEYLTIVRKSTSLNINMGKPSKLAEQYVQKNSQVKIDYQNFIQSFIQVAYLIYTSKYYGLNPLIQNKDVRIQQNYGSNLEKKFIIIIYYRFSDEPRASHTYSIIVKQIYNFLISLHKKYQNKVKQTQLQSESNSAIKNFISQVKTLQQAILSKLDSAQRQRQFYVCLEQTDLFREHSMLLKIKNASILDYIRTKVGKFKTYKQIDVNLVNQYNNEKKKIKCDIEELKRKQKHLQRNIIQFFEEITKTSDRFKLRIQSDHQNYKTRFIFTIFDNVQQNFSSRLAKMMGKSQETMQIQGPVNPNKDKAPYIEYQIEYNSERNLICVRLMLSSIVCSSESADYVMFQSNVLAFQSANISLQFVQDKPTQKQPTKKSLAFRGSSCFNNKQPTLQKILLLMDLTMIAAKIYEPQLISIRKNFMIDKDPQKLSTIYKKISHYTKVFLRCAKKVYNQ